MKWEGGKQWRLRGEERLCRNYAKDSPSGYSSKAMNQDSTRISSLIDKGETIVKVLFNIYISSVQDYLNLHTTESSIGCQQ